MTRGGVRHPEWVGAARAAAALLLGLTGCGVRVPLAAELEPAAARSAAAAASVAAPPSPAERPESALGPLTLAMEELRRDLAALQADVATLREEIAQARAGIEAATRPSPDGQRDALDALDRRVTASEAGLGQLAGTVGGVETTVDGLADQVARLEAVSTPVPRSRLATGGKGTRAATAVGSPEEIFDRAMESFRGGELGQAILDFEEFVGKNPRHPLVPSAQFWIAEAYFRARDFENAVSGYQKTVTLAPKGDKAADALLRLGLALRALKREDRAREAWGRLVRDFPDSEAAKRGRVLLRESGRGAEPKPSP